MGEVLPRAGSGALAVGAKYEPDVDRRGQQSPGDQPLNLLEHGRVVDLQLGLDAAIEHLLGKPFDLGSGVVEHERAAVRGEEQDEPHIQRAHLRIEQCGAQALLVGLGQTRARRQLDDRVGVLAQARMDVAVDLRVGGVASIGIARVDMQHGGSRLPGGDALRDDLVRLLGQRRGGGLAVVTAGEGAGDDGAVLNRHWATHR